MRLVSTAGVLWLGLCVVASAQDVVLLPHAGDADLGAERVAAERAVADALRAQGMSVGGPPDGGCTLVHCATELLAGADGAKLAVATAVWRSNGLPQVHVTLVDASGNRFSGVASVQGADTAGAARAALVDARGLQLLGPGPWVRIDGAPEGARVEIDGRFVGSLPYRGALAAGDHQLLVKAPGHAPQVRGLEVPLDPAGTLEVEVTLDPQADAIAPAERAGPGGAAPVDAPPSLEPTDRPSAWNLVLGGALVVGGLALALVEPLQAAAKDGDCVDARCERVYHFGTRSALTMALGGALAGAGVTLLLWQPLRADAPGLAVNGEF